MTTEAPPRKDIVAEPPGNVGSCLRELRNAVELLEKFCAAHRVIGDLLDPENKATPESFLFPILEFAVPLGGDRVSSAKIDTAHLPVQDRDQMLNPVNDECIMQLHRQLQVAGAMINQLNTLTFPAVQAVAARRPVPQT